MGVDFFGKLQGVAVGEIGVRWCDCQDEAGLPLDELHDHAADLRLDVHRLVADGHLRQTRQVDQRQVQH